MDILLKEGTVNHNSQLYGLYWGINTLSVPLGELFNPQMIRAVLEASDEGKEILSELLGSITSRLKKYWERSFHNNMRLTF